MFGNTRGTAFAKSTRYSLPWSMARSTPIAARHTTGSTRPVRADSRLPKRFLLLRHIKGRHRVYFSAVQFALPSPLRCIGDEREAESLIGEIRTNLDGVAFGPICCVLFAFPVRCLRKLQRARSAVVKETWPATGCYCTRPRPLS
jgi:hypothetical protein